MAYQPKAGSLSLFKNDRKEKDTHPDYKGDGADLNGNPVWVSAWVKEDKNGRKYFSISMQAKEQPDQHMQAKANAYQPEPKADEPFSDDIPF